MFQQSQQVISQIQGTLQQLQQGEQSTATQLRQVANQVQQISQHESGAVNQIQQLSQLTNQLNQEIQRMSSVIQQQTSMANVQQRNSQLHSKAHSIKISLISTTNNNEPYPPTFIFVGGYIIYCLSIKPKFTYTAVRSFCPCCS